MFSRSEPNQYEVVFFGPGYGEGILIHIPSYGWVQIDSCHFKNRPFSLYYLNELGLSPKDEIKDVIISHFHDDHIKGMAETLEVCSNAEVYCSSAMCDEHFRRFLIQTRETGIQASNGLLELTKVFTAIEKSNRQINHVGERVTILPPRASNLLYAISPSSSAASYVRSIDSCPPFLKEDELNMTSIAILAELGGKTFLFGSDLEVSDSNDIGWERAIDIGKNSNIPKASFIKIPHHGSENGHHEDVWLHLVLPKPKSFCSLFHKGKTRLPKSNDIKRIKGLSSCLYLTSDPKKMRGISKQSKKNFQDFGIRAFQVPQEGFVRVRFFCGQSEEVQIFGNAKICD